MQQVRCACIAVIEHVRGVQTVRIGELVVEARGYKVFRGDLRVDDDEIPTIAGNSAVRERVKSQVRLYVGIDRYGCSVGEIAVASSGRENNCFLRVAQALP